MKNHLCSTPAQAGNETSVLFVSWKLKIIPLAEFEMSSPKNKANLPKQTKDPPHPMCCFSKSTFLLTVSLLLIVLPIKWITWPTTTWAKQILMITGDIEIQEYRNCWSLRPNLGRENWKGQENRPAKELNTHRSGMLKRYVHHKESWRENCSWEVS